MRLPTGFSEKMSGLLGDGYGDYLESLSGKPLRGLRVNTGKLTAAEFCLRSPFALQPVPWTENGFYVAPDAPVTLHPYYFAGLYYVQEPSAMLPAALLDVQPGERVLDLCAAPGGKATEIGARLQGQGLLVANDVSGSRAKALLKNLELHGIGNAMVCCGQPEMLLGSCKDYFDKVLVDAPCSGEGMFRRDPSMIRSYEQHGPDDYAPIQRRIADCAVQMLKPGGRMVYSTCTFSVEENERVLLDILDRHPQMRLVPAAPIEGAASLPGVLPGCVRLYPHRVRGEGHFAAVLEKDAADCAGDDRAPERNMRSLDAEEKAKETDLRPWREFSRTSLRRELSGDILRIEERLYLLMNGASRERGIRYLRTGLYLGDCKKNGFAPSQALAMFLRMGDAASAVSLCADDARVARYLRGETVELSQEESRGLFSWTLFCVDGFPLGWAKWVGGGLRNKYYAGWRRN